MNHTARLLCVSLALCAALIPPAGYAQPAGSLACAEHVAWSRNANIYEVNIRQYTSDSTLGSYYAVRDYKGINPEFGTMLDFKRLVKQAHGLGMRVIIDWVANHTAFDHPWTVEHPDWYLKNDKGEIYPVTYLEGAEPWDYQIDAPGQ